MPRKQSLLSSDQVKLIVTALNGQELTQREIFAAINTKRKNNRPFGDYLDAIQRFGYLIGETDDGKYFLFTQKMLDDYEQERRKKCLMMLNGEKCL